MLIEAEYSEGFEEKTRREEKGSHPAILLARRTRTIKLCSSDARSEGQPGDSLGEETRNNTGTTSER
jgi:hypothetical protein